MKKILGLLYKDFLQLKNTFILFAVVLIFAATMFSIGYIEDINAFNALTIEDKNYGFLELLLQLNTSLFVFIFVPNSLILSSVGLDEKSKFDKFIISSGLKREYIVHEKFTFGLVSSSISIALYAVLYLGLFNLIEMDYPMWLLGLSYFLLSVGGNLFIITLTLFLTSLFGSIKLQAVSILITLFASWLIIGTYLLSGLAPLNETKLYINFGIFGFYLLLSLGLYLLSIKVYKNKEF